MAEFHDPVPIPGGKGYELNTPRPCPECGGVGSQVVGPPPNSRSLLPVRATCRRCGGTGEIRS